MTDYTKTTDFAAKDSLPSGDSGKIIKGTEFETEFDNIATAVATKSNIASPTFTGTTTIPTVDINGGAIDGTTVGAASASTGAFTTLTASTSLNIASSTTVDGVLDEDNMASDSASKLATQQSIKAYVDSQIGANNELSEVLSNGNTTGGTDIAVGTGDDITFADSSKAIFGADSDLEIYHDGLNSYIAEGGTGNLQIQAQNLSLEDSTGTRFFLGIQGGETRLYNQGNQKVAVTSTGVDVTGTVTADGLTVDGGANLLTRTSSGAEIDVLEVRNNATAASTASTIKFVNSTAAGSNSGSSELVAVRTGTNTGDFKIRTSNSTGSMIDRLLVDSDGDISFYEDTGTTAKFFWDASAERLGIGTTSPDRPLHIAGNPAMLLLEDTGGAADDKRAQLQVDSGVFEINSRNDDNSSRVDNIFIADLGTGNVGIGTSNPQYPLHTYGFVGISDDDDSARYRFIVDDDGTDARFRIRREKANNALSASNDLTIVGGNVGIGVISPASNYSRVLHLHNTSTGSALHLTDGTSGSGANDGTDLLHYGTDTYITNRETTGNTRFFNGGSEAMRIDSSGHAIIPAGVTLGTAAGTYNADNTLDDYEVGTFTFTLHDAASGGNQSSTSVTGYYTKIGNKVTMNVYAVNNIDTTGMTASNYLYFSLPFSSSSTGRSVGSVIHHGFTYAGSTIYQDMKPFIGTSGSRGIFSTVGYGAADSFVRVSDITTGDDDIHTLTLTYFV